MDGLFFCSKTVLIPSTYVFGERRALTLIHCVLAFLFGYSLLEVLPIILRIFLARNVIKSKTKVKIETLKVYLLSAGILALVFWLASMRVFRTVWFSLGVNHFAEGDE